MATYLQRHVLNAGSGPQAARRMAPLFLTEEWKEIRLDIDPGVGPTVVGSVTDIKSLFQAASFDAVWSSHTLEHLFAHEVADTLEQFKYVLKPDGFALIFCPDLESVAEQLLRHGVDRIAYVSQAGPITALDMLYGHIASISGGRHFMAHNTGFTAERLGNLLLEAGFPIVNVRRDENFEICALAFAEDADQHRIQSELAECGYDLMEPSI